MLFGAKLLFPLSACHSLRDPRTFVRAPDENVSPRLLLVSVVMVTVVTVSTVTVIVVTEADTETVHFQMADSEKVSAAN